MIKATLTLFVAFKSDGSAAAVTIASPPPQVTDLSAISGIGMLVVKCLLIMVRTRRGDVATAASPRLETALQEHLILEITGAPSLSMLQKLLLETVLAFMHVRFMHDSLHIKSFFTPK